MSRLTGSAFSVSGLRSARSFLSALVLGAVTLMSGWAHAAYPERPISLVLSFPPAGASDILARAIGQKLGEVLGQTVVIENKPGAGGYIGMAYASKATPDGYTIYLSSTTNAAIAASAYSTHPAHLIKDFAVIAGVATVPHMLVVPASLPVNTVPQLISYIKASPGKYNFASQGAGTLSHLESEVFKNIAGLDLVHVPYKGSSQALPDLIAGTASMMFDSIPASLPHVKSGRLKVLAVASSKRVGLLPNVPTVDESGLKGFEANNYFGLAAPKNTPAPILAALSKAVQTALGSAELKQRMQEQGVDLKFMPPEEFATITEQEFRVWGKAVEAAKVKLD
ncbi:tripartite tricarboxylate transporter substrate binding protein [Polaromonas sp. YR568]|uniref:Bug family tripartite tricarboxylate transporter substrate binding protein n=1 Tax=Polaromonas sp. YR568 TaxID=1855301 RepID=UPI003137FF94